MKRICITGAMGFVGAHLVEHILKSTDWEIVTLDRLDTSGNPNRLADMECWNEQKHRVRTVFWDLKAALNDQVMSQLGGPFDYIAHLAAGSHVDRSIENPRLFFEDNMIGTVNLLEYARDGGLEDSGKFLYFSTDEVYGPYPMDLEGGFPEWARLNPNNPYAAAKAAAEMAVIAYANTYRIPCVITNTMNIFASRQHPEKFVPMVIRKSMSGEKVFIHANEDLTQAGRRHYLHASHVCAATLWILEHGGTLNRAANEGRYNIVGDIEMDNLAFAQLIHSYVKEVRPEIPDLNYEMVSFHASRPGHDLRYALDGKKLKSEGFEFPNTFHKMLRSTVHWTIEHPEWL